MTGRRVPQGCVNNYIDILRQKMKASLSSALPEGGEKEICYVLNTGEYCAETIPQLEALIQKNIDEEYKEKVSFNEEQDQFYDVIANAIKSLVSGLQSQLEPAYRAMSKIEWASVEMVRPFSSLVLPSTLVRVTCCCAEARPHRIHTHFRCVRSGRRATTSAPSTWSRRHTCLAVGPACRQCTIGTFATSSQPRSFPGSTRGSRSSAASRPPARSSFF